MSAAVFAAYWVTVFLLFWVALVPWFVLAVLVGSEAPTRKIRLCVRIGTIIGAVWVLITGVGIWLPVMFGVAV